MKQISFAFLIFISSISFLCRADFHYTMSAKIPHRSMIKAYCFTFSDEQKPKIAPNIENNSSDLIKWEKGSGSCPLKQSVSCLGYKEGPPNGIEAGGNPPQFLFQEPIKTSITVYLNYFEEKTNEEIEGYKKNMRNGCRKAGGRYRDNSN